jgi:hypothetical protein
LSYRTLAREVLARATELPEAAAASEPIMTAPVAHALAQPVSTESASAAPHAET